MIAVDTNVLVYAVDASEPIKGAKAVALLRELESQQTVLLWQVVCEFGATLLRKKPKSEVHVAIPEVLDAWLGIFPLALPSIQVARLAWKIMAAHQVSYWDSLLLAGCVDAGVTTLYSEDLQSRPKVEGVDIIDPFR
jgi:predicted nucleic acid-binding protein